MEYNRIVYPERAEYLNEDIFQSYKVFLNHWNDLASKFKSNFEESILRRVSKTLIVVGEQSSGKTLLANKIDQDFRATKEKCRENTIEYDRSNIWHRIVSGVGKNNDLIKSNTDKSVLLHIENNAEWVERVKSFCGANSDRTCVIIADNCENHYFIQGIMGMTDTEFLQFGYTETLLTSAAQRFVTLCRTDLRGAMFAMFTNNSSFAESFYEKVNKLHNRLVETIPLPIPSPQDKETIIRVNTNRLNPFSYWYCLDRAGVEEKLNVLEKIKSEAGFKDVFEAVDNAIQKASPSRVGRPPKKCLLTLFAFTDQNDITGKVEELGIAEIEKNINNNEFVDIATFKNNWQDFLSFGDVRKGKLLQSEWNLRIVLAGNQFTSLLLSQKYRSETKKIIESCLKYHGPGTQTETIRNHKDALENDLSILSTIPQIDLSAFWASGQVRSHQYEKELLELFPNYNKSDEGFLSYRPDWVVEPYSVCKLASSRDSNIASVNDAIRREAIVCEFTALKDFNKTTVQTYLNRKISNYVNILQDQ
ncbi:hypothetical protein [Asaia spathodeae]|uniref:Uncharacterized protein n=1 Tax=Asaia spathodeae TaxID=657016 RepID=A0ABX2P1H5_9PROT|nr:hypothetical protein [Asaia spathodeae]GBR14891.1 hypothetical protein AA105894_1195 [Asaia spathodeae NBRC 105894]